LARINPLSGFPEWLPSGRIVEQQILDTLRRTFELHGFTPIATRAVEPLGQLLRKGETSKEVYVLRRLQAEDSASGTSDADLGLHFDLTVPLARYVLENAGKLQFPFKRYQIQSVWRGERPQDGRFREFIQADIDAVGAGQLPAHFEIDLPLVIADAFAALAEIGVPPIRISVNNRKVAEGFYTGLGLSNVDEVLRAIDKLDKIGSAGVTAELVAGGATPEQAAACLELAGMNGHNTPNAEVIEQARAVARAHGAETELFDTGLAELAALVAAADRRAPGVVVVDFKIARGLDYYTGAVYETALVGHEDLGSICSGGRYDTLASDGKATYPGVGLSIGVSRLVARLLSTGLVAASRTVPAAVLVAVNDEDSRTDSDQVAAQLRARGIPVEVSPNAAKFGKQIQYAERRGIPFVWFVGESHQVKDIRSGEQVPADPAAWCPPQQDWWPQVQASEQLAANSPVGKNATNNPTGKKASA